MIKKVKNAFTQCKKCNSIIMDCKNICPNCEHRVFSYVGCMCDCNCENAAQIQTADGFYYCSKCFAEDGSWKKKEK